MLKYDFKRVVGEGSFGKALLCHRKSDGRQCIVKQIALDKMCVFRRLCRAGPSLMGVSV